MLHVHARAQALIKVWSIPTIPYALIKKCALINDVCLLIRVHRGNKYNIIYPKMIVTFGMF